MSTIHQLSLKLMLVLIAVWSISSCSNDDNISDLDETIFVRHKNADMPAYIHGNGSDKVFLITLHGGPGGLGLGFRNDMFKNRIEREYAVVYFDQRGAGMSQGGYAEEDVTIDLLGEDILALVQVIKAKYGNDSRFFLLGHSYGGTVGTAALLQDQKDFLGWIEIGGANNTHGIYFANIENHSRVADEQLALGNSINYWESVKNLVANVDNSNRNRDDFRKLNQEASIAENRLRDDGIINREKDQANLAFDYNLLTALWNIGTIQNIEEENFSNVNFTERLSEIEIPTLLLWGKYDMVVPPSFGTIALEEIGALNKELVIFERSGHSPMASEPNLFADKLLQFMEANK